MKGQPGRMSSPLVREEGFREREIKSQMAQTECQLENQKVSGSVPSQSTHLGCWPGSQSGACERQPIDVSLAHQCFSPSLSPSFPLSLKKLIKYF